MVRTNWGLYLIDILWRPWLDSDACARIYDRSQTRRDHGERGEGRAGAARGGEEGGEEEERGGEERGEEEQAGEASAGGGGGAACWEHGHGDAWRHVASEKNVIL